MGGNAGTQMLTVAVRALAMKELTRANAMHVLSKEILVGVFNGILFAVLIGFVAWFWSGDPAIGMVIVGAMVIALVVAGFAGTAIPLGLARSGIDPAVGCGRVNSRSGGCASAIGVCRRSCAGIVSHPRRITGNVE